MPEGDTLVRTADALRVRLLGKRMVAARPYEKLAGATVAAVEPNGKHLLIRFDNGLVVHSHLRMTGIWYLYRPGEAWTRPAHQARLVLEADDTVAVLFNAPTVELLREKEVDLGHLGPDVLAPEFDLDEVLARSRRAADRSLGELLLDQRVAAGIGNIYRCESLWALQLDPWRKVEATDDDTLSRLYSEARRQLQGGVRGRHTRAVHARSGRPCPRCLTLIKTRRQGDLARITYYCPTCQKAPLT